MTSSSKPSVNFATIPVFEVKDRNGNSMKIFANGQIEGFPGGYTIIFNRIPMFLAQIQNDETKGK